MKLSSADSIAAGRRTERGWLHALRWQIVAAVTLIIGYTDLWRGGAVVSPLLITIGYLILVPIAVVQMPMMAEVRARQ